MINFLLINHFIDNHFIKTHEDDQKISGASKTLMANMSFDVLTHFHLLVLFTFFINFNNISSTKLQFMIENYVQ